METLILLLGSLTTVCPFKNHHRLKPIDQLTPITLELTFTVHHHNGEQRR